MSKDKNYKEIILSAFKMNVRQYAMIIALLAIWLIFSVITKVVYGEFIYLTPRNLSNLFIQSATVAILAIGMTLIIVAGHIDLSVGSVLGFCGAVAAMLMIRLNMPVIPTILITIIVGVIIGLWHGYWVAYKGVPAFIVSLASMLAFRGAIIGITGGQTQGLEMAPKATAAAFRTIGQAYLPKINQNLPFHDTSLYFCLAFIILFWIFDFQKRRNKLKYGFKVLPMELQILKNIIISVFIALISSIMIFYMGIPYSIILVLVLTLLFSFIANNTTFGRHLYAIGGNIEAARLSGINIRLKVLLLFMMMGIMTSIAGIVYTSRLNAATTSAGVNAELDAIASTVIGGTSLMGGEGTIIGAVIGALVMTSLDNGMSLLNLDITFQYIIKGLILLMAVWFDISTRKKTR
ncbi:MAG: sugar ABC transporter permease [Brevinematia bacterium]